VARFPTVATQTTAGLQIQWCNIQKPQNHRPRRFRFGIDALLDRPPGWLRTARIGLVCHPASVDSQLVHSADRLHGAIGRRLVALFGPQHGARGEKQDNMVESADYRDRQLELPVFSLYGQFREPTREMTRGIDVLLIDLQDVGTRVYTFVSTMVACLRAAARFGFRVVVLDRPNPIGGVVIEGHGLDSAFRSFVGELSIPMRHGMTMGELSRWAKSELALDCELDVVPMAGWHRRDLWSDLGVEWIAPSPNMPSPATALVYPGAVLFEGTNVSEGRGTTRPFEVIGAPFIDPYQLCAFANRHRLPGTLLRPLYFEPTFHKWSGQTCGGVQIHVMDPRRFLPYRTTIVLLSSIARLWPNDFAWRDPPYEYESVRMPIDIITGSDRVRTGISSGEPVARVLGGVAPQVARFATRRREFLLYQ
jgi:uncharacterized protein YbbC (DUF1343 family)